MPYGAQSLNCRIEKGLIGLFFKAIFHSLGKMSLILSMQNIFSVHSVILETYVKAPLNVRFLLFGEISLFLPKILWQNLFMLSKNGVYWQNLVIYA